MFDSAAPYVMSVSMMLFSALSARCLIAFIRSLDPPEPETQAKPGKQAA